MEALGPSVIGLPLSALLMVCRQTCGEERGSDAEAGDRGRDSSEQHHPVRD